MDSENVCSICWDLFRKPKYLPCRHTFCLPCLKSYVKQSQTGGSITCPLCRKDSLIPEDGLESLFDNFYVELKEPEVEKFVNCGICNKTTEASNVCRHCMNVVCFNCLPSHKLAVELSGENFPKFQNEADNEDEDVELDNDEINDTPSVPLNLLMSQSVKSQYNAALFSSFCVQMPVQVVNAQTQISCLLPNENGIVLTVVNGGPEAVIYKVGGEIVDRVNICPGITSVCRKGDNILVSSRADNIILNFSGEGITPFARTGDFSPLSISSFLDGRIVVTGITTIDTAKQQSSKGNSEFGVLQIFNTKGKLMKEIIDEQEGRLFRCPGDVAVSPVNNSIFVSDRGNGRVVMFHEDGSLLKMYKSQSRPLMLFMNDYENGQFTPLGLCFDSAGYVFIINGADATIHILQPSGEFWGYLLACDSDRFGNPNSIAISSDGKIWLGDNYDGTIRVFEVISYKNQFREY